MMYISVMVKLQEPVHNFLHFPFPSALEPGSVLMAVL